MTPNEELRAAASKLRKVAGAHPLYAPLAVWLDWSASDPTWGSKTQALAVAHVINGGEL